MSIAILHPHSESTLVTESSVCSHTKVSRYALGFIVIHRRREFDNYI